MKVILLILIFSLFSFSCGKKKEAAAKEYLTLQSEFNTKNEEAKWTYQIEGKRLSQNIDSFEAVSNQVSLTPSAFIALQGGHSFSGIYPYIEGFTTLDVTDAQGELLELIEKFCNEFIKYSNDVSVSKIQKEKKLTEDIERVSPDSSTLTSLMARETFYSLVLYIHDTESLFPVKSFMIGKPFITDENFEIPVRFTCNKKILYTYIYPIQQNGGWKIQQLEIERTEDYGGSE